MADEKQRELIANVLLSHETSYIKSSHEPIALYLWKCSCGDEEGRELTWDDCHKKTREHWAEKAEAALAESGAGQTEMLQCTQCGMVGFFPANLKVGLDGKFTLSEAESKELDEVSKRTKFIQSAAQPAAAKEKVASPVEGESVVVTTVPSSYSTSNGPSYDPWAAKEKDEPIPCPTCGSIECCGLTCGPTAQPLANAFDARALINEIMNLRPGHVGFNAAQDLALAAYAAGRPASGAQPIGAANPIYWEGYNAAIDEWELGDETAGGKPRYTIVFATAEDAYRAATKLAVPVGHAELTEEQVQRIVRLHHNTPAQVFAWAAMTADFNALLRASQAGSQQEVLPKPENIKWLIDASNQAISELSKQEHLDSDTFRWLCNAVGQVERDLRRQAGSKPAGDAQ